MKQNNWTTSCTQNEAESARETLIWLESVTEKETGNTQPGACVDVLPRCWSMTLCLCLCFCWPAFHKWKLRQRRHKHEHKHKKNELVHFSFAFAYVHQVFTCLHMCLCLFLGGNYMRPRWPQTSTKFFQLFTWDRNELLGWLQETGTNSEIAKFNCYCFLHLFVYSCYHQ